MKQTYNVYCDESCHLEHDDSKVMVLGAIWCPKDQAREIAEEIREIKVQHNLPSYFEVKWTKVSPGKLDFYVSLIEYFFRREDLNFRAVVIPDKSKLRHELYDQDHDLWYYKMYYVMLKEILDPLGVYCIYLDIKDTRSADKVHGLEKVLQNVYFQSTIERVQNVRSEEIEQVQMADLILGAIGYANRKLNTSGAKSSLVKKIEKERKRRLTRNSARCVEKFNLFIWEASWRADQ
jgi:hypothetical protein